MAAQPPRLASAGIVASSGLNRNRQLAALDLVFGFPSTRRDSEGETESRNYKFLLNRKDKI